MRTIEDFYQLKHLFEKQKLCLPHYLKNFFSLAKEYFITCFLSLNQIIYNTGHLDVDERYQQNYTKWLSKHGGDLRLKSVILSPQQHSILNKNEPFVFLRGEPGMGKTLLLLAKALFEALNPADNVIFVIPKQNSKLTELLKQLCGRMGLSSLSNFQIVELKEFNQHFLPIQLKTIVCFSMNSTWTQTTKCYAN